MSRTSTFCEHNMSENFLAGVMFDQKNFSEMEKEELAALHRVSMQYRSHMKNLIRWFKSNELPYDVATIRAFHDGKLIGWGYIELNYSIDTFEVGVYVQREHRGKGLGTAIMERMKAHIDEVEKGKSIIAKPWNHIGESFFAKSGIPVIH